MDSRPQGSSERAWPPAAPLRVAVAGLGERGLAHAAVLSTIERATLVGLADPRPAARRAAAGAGFSAPSFADVDRLLARARPDAVVVSAPLGARAEIARRALGAGAAVLIEKPIALAYGESARL